MPPKNMQISEQKTREASARKKQVPAKFRRKSFLMESPSLSDENSSSLLSESSSEEEEESSEIIIVSKPKKKSVRKPHFIFEFLDKNDSDYSCRYCEYSVKDERPLKKFPTGNVRRHLERKHLNVLHASGYQMHLNTLPEVSYSSEDLNYDVMQWLAVKCLPFSTVDDDLFRKITEKLGLNLLKRKQLAEVYLPKVHRFYVDKLKHMITRKEFDYSITSDGWSTSLNKKIHWCSTTIHFIDDNWILQRRLLDMGDLGTVASASVIGDLWSVQLSLWNLNPDNLVACVVDGAANFQCASRKNSSTFNLWCYCHQIHLLVEDILHNNSVHEVYVLCKSVVKYVNKSFEARSKLISALHNPGATRWNSAQVMFQSLIANKSVMATVLERSEIIIDREDWRMIIFLWELLKLTSVALRSLESDCTPTANLILLVITRLKEQFGNLKEQFPAKEGIIEYSLAKVNERFKLAGLTEENSYLILAAWCDPRLSNFKFISSEEDREFLLNYCINEARNFISEFGSTASNKDEETSFLFGSPAMRDEITIYLSIQEQTVGKFDVLKWWHSHQSLFPNLCRFVKKYLCIPASSATSERAFSKANLVCSKLRSRLTNERAKMLTYISVNHAMLEPSELITDSLDWSKEF